MSHTTYVEPYVKADGTKVRGHIRHVRGEEGGGGGSHGTSDSGSYVVRESDPQRGRRDWRSRAAEQRKPMSAGVSRAQMRDFVAGGAPGGETLASRPMPQPSPDEVREGLRDPKASDMLRATFKTGQVSRTAGQRKWLAAQMSREERERLADTYDESVVRSGKKVFMSRHLKDKIARGELSVPQDVVEETLATFSESFIEYNVTERNGRESRRVLLRNYGVVREVRVKGRTCPANLCIVIDMDSCCMVTAYWNALNDRHATLNSNRYENPRISADGDPARKPKASTGGGTGHADDDGKALGEDAPPKRRRRRRHRRRRGGTGNKPQTEGGGGRGGSAPRQNPS